MKTLLTTTALVLALTAGAYAGPQLSAGPIYSAHASSGYCWFTNLGAANITITSQLMYTWTSTTPISTSASCGGTIVPAQSCYITPTTSDYNALSCKVTFSTKAADVRGSLELTDASGNEISQVELR